MDYTLEASSVVANSDSDETHLEYPAMWKGLYGLTENVDCSTRRLTQSTDNHLLLSTEGCDSPLLPVVQPSVKVKLEDMNIQEETTLSCDDSDCPSELSQPLIPLAQPAVNSTRPKPKDNNKIEHIELSQSLLPQTLSEKVKIFGHLGLQRNNSQPIATDLPKSKPRTRSSRKSAIILSRENTALAVTKSQKSKQATVPDSGEYSHLSSQGDLTSSQASVSSTDKITARLERLLESLNSAPQKQKRVTEIAVSQCVGKIQDNLYHKLKHKQLSKEQQAVLKKYLQIAQSCLSKLLGHLKVEKSLQFSQRRNKKDPVLQFTVKELEQRQRELHNLLKRQKSLVEQFKYIVRTQDTEVSDTGANEGLLRQKRTEIAKDSSIPPTSTTTFDNSLILGSQTITNLKDFDNPILSGTSTSGKVTTQDSGKSFKSVNKLKTSVVHEVFDLSQDVTTIPDTQDVSSQHTEKSNEDKLKMLSENRKEFPGKTISSITQSTTEIHSTKVKKPPVVVRETITGKTEEHKRIPKNTILGTTARFSRILKRKVPWSPEQDESKKIKKVTQKSTSYKTATAYTVNDETADPTTGSEMLWLKMLNKKDSAELELRNEQNLTDITEKAVVTCSESQNKQNHKTKSETKVPSSKHSEVVQTDFGKEMIEQKHTNIISDSCKPDSIHPLSFDRQESHEKMQNKTDSKKDTETVAAESAVEVASVRQEVGFLSPRPVHDEPDIYTDVSPTATSMSSDVFLVKAKELQRRMKMREKIAERKAKDTNQPPEVIQPISSLTDREFEPSRSRKDKNEADKIGIESTTVKERSKTAGVDVANDINEISKDTISDAIDSVIAKSKKVLKECINQCHSEVPEKINENAHLTLPVLTHRPQPAYEIRKLTYALPLTQPEHSDCIKKNVGPQPSISKVEETKNVRRVLPSLKVLLHSGLVSPGKNVLSLHLKGVVHKATITPLSKIRSSEGLLFNTPLQWLSTLTDGEIKKKRSTYTRVLYMGRTMLEICKQFCHQQENEKRAADAENFHISQHKDISAMTSHIGIIQNPNQPHVEVTNQAIQTDISGQAGALQSIVLQPPVRNKLSDDEIWLDKLLSDSHIKLLTDQDLVPCTDLPEDFWTQDYARVQLSVELWEALDKW